jgi:hypothetical protein
MVARASQARLKDLIPFGFGDPLRQTSFEICGLLVAVALTPPGNGPQWSEPKFAVAGVSAALD